jgi:hypothetical protein
MDFSIGMEGEDSRAKVARLQSFKVKSNGKGKKQRQDQQPHVSQCGERGAPGVAVAVHS